MDERDDELRAKMAALDRRIKELAGKRRMSLPTLAPGEELLEYGEERARYWEAREEKQKRFTREVEERFHRDVMPAEVEARYIAGQCLLYELRKRKRDEGF